MYSKKSMRVFPFAVLISAFCFTAWAEEAVKEIDTVTVTARKIAEDPKDVPFSLSVVAGDEVAERRLESFEDALRQTTGIEVTTFGGADTYGIKIRGVGALQKASMDDTSVVINIDGVPMSGSNASLNIMDVERMEILKGPQGTIMGRNSEAGAINIVTKRPTRNLEGYLKGEIGTEGTFVTEGAVSGAVSKTLSARFAAKYSGNDHQVKYMDTDEPVAEPRDIAVRGTLLWEPTEKTDVTLIVEHNKIDNRVGADVLMPYDEKQELDVPRDAYDGYKTSDRITLELMQELQSMQFASVTGYSYTEGSNKAWIYNSLIYDKWFGMGNLEGSKTDTSEETTVSQEFRLSSKPNAKTAWVTGVNYFYSDRKRGNIDTFDIFYPDSWYNAYIDNNYTTDSAGIFGEMTYPVTDKFKLTAGLRYTWEKKEYDGYWKGNPGNSLRADAATDSAEIDDDYLTGRVAGSYAVSPNTNIYAVYSRGHKSGGFNDYSSGLIYGLQNDLMYEAATVDSYEIGLKTEHPSKRAGLNMAAFINKTEKDHMLIFDSVTRLSTAENFDTETKGLELEGWVKPGKGFSINAGLGYTLSEITGVPADTQSDTKEGNDVPDVAKWNASFSVTHIMSLPDFMGLKSPALTTKITNRYVGEREGDAGNNFKFDAYNKLDAKIGISTENLEFYLWADNILDEHYDLYGWFYGVSYVDGSDIIAGMPAMGRTVGVGAAYYF